MAQIPQYTARKLLTTDGALNTQVRDYTGQALEGLGRQISAVGDRLQSRIDQREEFKAQNDYNKFQFDLNNDLADNAANNMPEGGIGFHDNFMGSIYKQRRDEFMSKVPARLRERFETLTADGSGSNFGEWANKAASAERDATRSWATDNVKVNTESLANAISLNPEEYDDRLKQGYDLIDTMPMMSTQEKKELKRSWENMAQISHLNAMMERNPEDVLKLLGANPNHLSPGTQFEILKQAVVGQESGGNPDAISSAGAVGLMQVMPETAREIAREMGDANFPVKREGVSMREHEMDVVDYLRNPHVNVRYGEFYLRKMMGRYAGDVEAALVAYHSGPGAADKWIKNGRDDAVLGPVGRRYYKEVIARMPGLGKEDIPNLPPLAESNAFLKSRISLEGRMEGVKSIDNLEPEFQSRLAAMLQAAPPEMREKLGLFSAWRSREHQEQLFAKSDKSGKWVARPGRSNHEHGGAADLAYEGQSLKKAPKEVIEWVHANAARFGLKFPLGHEPWHVEMQETRGGKMFVAGRYATLPYDRRQSFINNADTELSRRLTAQRAADATVRVQVQQQLENELALIRSTGSGSGAFDETTIISAVGQDDYMKYMARKAEAQRTFTATDGVESMTPEQMEQRINDYKPNPDAPDFVEQQRVQAAIVKRADEITRERANSPDKAALRFKDVQDAWGQVVQEDAVGKPSPQSVQRLIALMLARQKDFGVMPKAQAPIPSEWAFDIGQRLTRVVPERGKEVTQQDIRNSIIVQYRQLETVFGEYTDEVVLYALTQYKGMNPSTAKLVTAMMATVARGGELKVRDDAQDKAQVEGMSWYQSLGNWIIGGGDPEATPQRPDAPPSNETILRVIGRLNSVDTPEDEELLIEQYGKAAVDAAKLRIKQGED